MPEIIELIFSTSGWKISSITKVLIVSSPSSTDFLNSSSVKYLYIPYPIAAAMVTIQPTGFIFVNIKAPILNTEPTKKRPKALMNEVILRSPDTNPSNPRIDEKVPNKPPLVEVVELSEVFIPSDFPSILTVWCCCSVRNSSCCTSRCLILL